MFHTKAALVVLMVLALSIGDIALAAPDDAPLVGDAIVWPPATTSTDATVLANDSVVKVSDAKLKAALVSATKLGAGKQLHQSDLMKLAGGLDLSGKGIANADGLQYCVNVTAINLSGNKLTSLPAAMKNLTHLDTLSLANNKFVKFPDVLGDLTALTTLSLRGNALDKLPTTLNVELSMVKWLDLSGNKLATIPVIVGKLSNLETLYWADNGVKIAPPDIFKLSKLVNLDLSGNLLEALPTEAALAPALANLDIRNNIIAVLPTGIGQAPALSKLFVRSNRLTEIEPSLCVGKVKTLQLDVNRIAKLPTVLSGKSFDQISLEWNMLDMSEGSSDRKIMESVTAANGSNYLHQLAALKVSASQATRTTVRLQWQPIPDGTDGDTTWTVAKYYVYNADDASNWKKLAELDSMAGMYVVTGLKVGQPVRLMIGVEYDLKTSYYEGSTRNFTEVETQTLLADDPSPAADATPIPQITDDSTVTAQPSATVTVVQPATTGKTGSSGALVAALIVVSLLAAGAIASLVYLMLRQRQRSQYRY